MAAVKRSYASRSAISSNKKENTGKSQSITPFTCRLLTVAPCVNTAAQPLEYNVKSTPNAMPETAMNRCKSGIVGTNCQPWLLSRRQKMLVPSSANYCRDYVAPRGLLSYLQLCRPINPRERSNNSGCRTYNDSHNSLSKPGKDEPLTKEDPGLVVYGTPFGQPNEYQRGLQQEAKRVQFHVYLPCQQQSGRGSTRLHSEEEETCSMLTNLNLRECKDLQSL